MLRRQQCKYVFADHGGPWAGVRYKVFGCGRLAVLFVHLSKKFKKRNLLYVGIVTKSANVVNCLNTFNEFVYSTKYWVQHQMGCGYHLVPIAWRCWTIQALWSNHQIEYLLANQHLPVILVPSALQLTLYLQSLYTQAHNDGCSHCSSSKLHRGYHDVKHPSTWMSPWVLQVT